MYLLYYLSLCLQHGSLKGEGSLGRKIQGSNKEDTERPCKYKCNYKSQFIIIVRTNYKVAQIQVQIKQDSTF